MVGVFPLAPNSPKVDVEKLVFVRFLPNCNIGDRYDIVDIVHLEKPVHSEGALQA